MKQTSAAIPVALVVALIAVSGCLTSPANNASSLTGAASDPNSLAGSASGNACGTPAAENGNIDCSKWFPACEHPWPCADGSEWPVDLEGPFGLKEVLNVAVNATDGTKLVGWIGLPDVPEGTRVPVLLSVSPSFPFCNFRLDMMVLGPTAGFYPGTCLPTPASPEFWSDPPHWHALETWGLPPIELVREGYAVALFSQRGTGASGGCYEMLGLVQNGDEAAIIESLANEPWSNGRVGIGGVSSSASTAMVGATTGVSALKTTVVAGTIQDGYTLLYTPQGAGSAFTSGTTSWGQAASVSLMPPLADPNGVGDAQRVERFMERASCPETIDAITLAMGGLQDDRNPEFWERHRLIDDLDNVTASLLIAQGFQDRVAHMFQDTYLWPGVDSPKRWIAGQWRHGWPIAEHQSPKFDFLVNGTEWQDIVVPWLDFWLKGLGSKPDGLERVDYEETGGKWRSSRNWPPSETQEEVVYLADKILSASPGAYARSFQSIPVTGNSAGLAESLGLPLNTWPAACDPTDQLASPTALVYARPMEEETWVLAGNPFVYLNISSNLPGGIVSINVYEASADYSCTAVNDPTKPEMHQVAFGAADLRFHQGNLMGTDFPVNTPTKVRVDLYDVAETIESGNRLLVIISYGEDLIPFSRISQPYYPTITAYEDSHLVLPFIEGTLGGDAPTIDYPPRPFMPE